jgi:chaperonin GroEL
MTDIKFDQEVRDGIKAGVDALANAVKVTLGPKGRNVIIHRLNGQDDQVTKDGVTVANAIELEGDLESIGANVVKRVAQKANKSSGDGTTTATVLAQAILNEGLKLVAAGYNPLDIKNGIDKATQVIVEELNKTAIPVTFDSPMIEMIATISSNNDTKIGKLVADAFLSVGNNGAVSVEDGTGFETTWRKVDGLQFDRGMITPFFSTSPEKMEVSMQNPLILVIDGSMTTKEQAVAVLTPVIELRRSLIIIAEDITGEALSTLTINKLKGGHSICAVKTPGFGTYRKELALDIAITVGAKLVPEDMVIDITKDFVDQLFGTAQAVTVDQSNTVIMGGVSDNGEVEKRIKEIEAKLNNKKLTTFEIDKLNERKAKLGGGVALIEVGAKSEIEMKEIKDRIVDAKEAVISALEEGVVLGGGTALLNCKDLVVKVLENSDEAIGVQLIMKAIEAPFRTICENAGVSADVKIDWVMGENQLHKSALKNKGYDAKTDKYADMLEKGILDPKKVTRIALESAASVAGTLLTTACAVIEK